MRFIGLPVFKLFDLKFFFKHTFSCFHFDSLNYWVSFYSFLEHI